MDLCKRRLIGKSHFDKLTNACYDAIVRAFGVTTRQSEQRRKASGTATEQPAAG
jgi:hypothetical protein